MRMFLAVGVALMSFAADRGTAPTLAAPEIIIFHGGPLTTPIVIASWNENHTILLPREPTARLTPSQRPSSEPRETIELALFWGAEWRVYATSPERLATLTPSRATQRGKYFPAAPGVRATISVGAISGPVSDSGLAVLSRHRIPIRTGQSQHSGF